jgi:hypothetical protein
MSEPILERHDAWRAMQSCLPPELATLVSAAENSIAALSSVRTVPLSGDAVHALAVTWQRLSAQVESGRLAVLAAIDTRDDVVPRTRGSQAAAFGQHALGLPRGQAHRDARDAAHLAQGGDLQELGSAYADGALSRAHVDVATRTHHALGAAARDAVVPVADLRAMAAELGPTGAALEALLAVADDGGIRQIRVVDAVLAHHARRLSVPEFDAVARRIVDHLNPPSDQRAHEQRFLHMSSTFDGSWVGKFSCGAAQGAVLKAALSALSAPRPGLAIDGDGVERVIPDERDLGARQMDALMELVAAALAAHGTDSVGRIPEKTSHDQRASHGEQPAGPRRPEPCAGSSSTNTGTSEPPEPAARPGSPEPPEPPEAPGPAEPPESEGDVTVVREPGVLAAPFPDADLVVVVGIEHLAAARAFHRSGTGGDPARDGPAGRSRIAEALASFRRTASPPDLGAEGHVDDQTLGLMACSASIRTVVLGSSGRVLDLGRSQRLATSAQRRALRARDGGCVVPGCRVPADGCHAHHRIPWEDGGATDLDNLVLVCARHHVEVHHGTWDIEMHDGAPWVRPPAWVDRTRPLLRNALHHGPECHASDDGP